MTSRTTDLLEFWKIAACTPSQRVSASRWCPREPAWSAHGSKQIQSYVMVMTIPRRAIEPATHAAATRATWSGPGHVDEAQGLRGPADGLGRLRAGVDVIRSALALQRSVGNQAT